MAARHERLVYGGWRRLYSDMEVKIEYAANPVLRKRIELARITEEIGTLGY